MKSIKNRNQDIPDVLKRGHRYCLQNRACVSEASSSILSPFAAVCQICSTLSVENKRLKSIKNRDQDIPCDHDIPDVRMAAEQVRSSLFPAKSRLCWS
jgi:hypothetical protein